MPEADYYIEIYRGSKQGRQAWRWRCVNNRNHRKMASGGEAYTNKQDCVTAAQSLFSPANTVHLIELDTGSQEVLRDGLPALNCDVCGHNLILHFNTQGCRWCDCPQTCRVD